MVSVLKSIHLMCNTCLFVNAELTLYPWDGTKFVVIYDINVLLNLVVSILLKFFFIQPWKSVCSFGCLSGMVSG